MVGTLATKRICQALGALHKSSGFDIVYAEAWTEENGHRVPRSTISRALNSDMKQFRSIQHGKMLARFVEAHARGKVSASLLLGEAETTKPRNFYKGATIYGDEIKGKNLSSANLRRAHFVNADISKSKFYGASFYEATFEGVEGANPIFCGARMKRTVLNNCKMRSWDFRGISEWRGAEFRNLSLGALLNGVDLSDIAVIENITMKSGAGATYGMKVQFDPAEITEGADSPELMAYYTELYAESDLEVMKVVWRLRGGGVQRCWLGGWPEIERDHPKAVKKLLEIWRTHPNWHIVERIEFADLMRACNGDPDKLEKLKTHAHYAMFGRALRWEIRLAKRRKLAMDGKSKKLDKTSNTNNLQ